MFSSDEERIVPKKRIDIATTVMQVILALFLLALFSLLFFEDLAPEISEAALTYLTPLFIAGLIGIPLAFGLYSRWNQQRQWQALAEELGFQTTQPLSLIHI